MIRSKNPRLDVAALNTRLRDELAADPESRPSERIARLAATIHIRTIENTLDRAEERAAARTQWPVELSSAPLLRSKRLQQFALKLAALVFRDQHEANAQFIRAQRESLALMRELVDRIDELEARLETERVTARADLLARRRSGE